jgi:nucleoside-diphosphate-sugar epimerase
MAPDSSGRVAIVVRAGGELGRATAQKLAAAGFTVIGVDRNEDGPKELPDGIRYEAGDATTRPWPGASSTGSLLRSDRPACWSTPEARITWAGREHGPAGLGAGGPDPGADFRFRAGEERRGDGVVQR